MTSWLPRYKIHTDFCDLTEPESLAKVATKTCRVVYFETPVNPTMELIDLQRGAASGGPSERGQAGGGKNPDRG